MCMHAQLCLTLCDPMDCSLPGSSVHGIMPARILKWVAISFSKGSSQHRGIEPMSPEAPALAGGFLTTEPPGEDCGWRELDAKCLPFSPDHIQSEAECFGQKKGEHSFLYVLCYLDPGASFSFPALNRHASGHIPGKRCPAMGIHEQGP